LPQGAPTSPMIANIIGAHIDDRIIMLIKVLNDGNPNLLMSYSRYADDLTLSYNDSTLNPNKLIHNIQMILEDEGFFMNIRKIRLFKKGEKKEVT
jgi:RNA-directed DNA polymerase